MTEASDDTETYHGYSVDDEDQPQSEGDSLTDNRGLDEPLDEGYSPPERWSPGEGFGNTPYEEATGETLDQRVAQEEPDADPYAEVDDDYLDDGEVGNERSGRLVADDEGLGADDDEELFAHDVGVDGAGSSAEEAAVHIVDD
jgi:hypothetical protein